MSEKKPDEVKKELEKEIKPISDREKYLAEIKELVEQLKIVDVKWAEMKGLESQREMTMLAIAERKGIIAYLNEKEVK